MFRRTLAIGMTAALWLGAPARAAAETVAIGAEDDWYPYGGQINGEARGFGVDLVRASFGAVGFEYGSEFDGNPRVTREAVSKEIAVLRMLAAGRVDYALAYEKVANWYFSENPKEFKGRFVAAGQIDETQMYCAFSKTFPRSRFYLERFNEGYAKMQKNGTYREIEKRLP